MEPVRSKARSRRWILWAACALIGLSIGYSVRTIRIGQLEVPSTDHPLSTDPSSLVAPLPSEPADETPHERPQAELSFSQRQVDLLLKNPTGFRLRFDAVLDSQRVFDREKWVDNAAEFFAWDDAQQSKVDQALARFAEQTREVIDQHALIDESTPSAVSIDYAEVAGPFANGVNQLREDLLEVTGDKGIQQLAEIAQLDELQHTITAQTKMTVTTEFVDGFEDRLVFAVNWLQGEQLFAQRQFMDARDQIIYSIDRGPLFPGVMPKLNLAEILSKAAAHSP